MPYFFTQENDPEEYEFTFFFWMLNTMTNLLAKNPNRGWTVRYVPRDSVLDTRDDKE